MEKEVKQEKQVLNIYQRMAAITNELGYVGKNLVVPVNKKGDSYKAVSDADVIAAIKPIEFKWGIYSYAYNREIEETKEITTTYGTVQQFIRLKIYYRFVNIDKPDEIIDTVSLGDGIDSGDKAPGKATTYAEKYALMKAYKLSTGDDPDKDASQEYIPKPIDKKPEVIKKDLLDYNNALDIQLKKMGVDVTEDIVADYILTTAKLNHKPATNVEYQKVIQVKDSIIKKKAEQLEKETLA